MVSLSKEESLQKISLRKDKIVSLTKSKPILDGKKARVALVLDFSGSMSSYFADGTVQSIIERIIPLALHFDDNGELDFWIFENGFTRLEGVTIDNFYGLADRVKSKYRMGGTNYAPVMQDVDKKYMTEDPSNLPNYVIFITDGDNSDKAKTEQVMKELSGHAIFWQFIGIGRSSFAFLEKLDDMSGRYVDNADFFQVNDINSMSDDELYSKLFTEFPSWLSLPQVNEMLNNNGKSNYKPQGNAGGFLGGLFRR